MPPPHPLTSLYRAGPPHDAAARAQLEAALAKHGSVPATAAALGFAEQRSLYKLMQKMGVEPPASEPVEEVRAPAKKNKPPGKKKRSSGQKKKKKSA